MTIPPPPLPSVRLPGPNLDTELDTLAEAFGVNLRHEHDPTLDRYGIWVLDPPGDEQEDELIGTGETLSEAIDAAREQLQVWERGRTSL